MRGKAKCGGANLWSSTWETEEFRPAQFTDWFPGQIGLHREILSQKKKKKKKRKEKKKKKKEKEKEKKRKKKIMKGSLWFKEIYTLITLEIFSPKDI